MDILDMHDFLSIFIKLNKLIFFLFVFLDGNKSSGDENDDNQQIELMEKVTILFDR